MGRWTVAKGSRGLAPATLIISSRHRLWQRYGPDGVLAIERAVGELVQAMAERGLSGTLAYVDDSPLLSRFGIVPAETGDPESVARVVRGLSARLAWTEEEARHVLILGDDGIVPFHRLPNPSPDGDELLHSDHPYAAEADAPLAPVRAVGRIPDTGAAGLVGALQAAAAAHRRLAMGEDLRLTEGAFGYSASVWKRAARGVFVAIGDPKDVRLSPPLSFQDRPEPGPTGPRFRYFNLHGLEDSPHWFGQRDPSFPADYPFFPVALRPADLRAAPGCVVFSEACHGAHITGRSVRESIALTCLAGGAQAFVGATGVAYGGLDGPLVAADLLARRFWDALLRGLPAGEALAWAKDALVEEALSRQGYLDAEDEKAVLNFVLYGDPSLVHNLPSVFAEDAAGGGQASGAVERAGPADMVGTQSVRPHNTETVASVPANCSPIPSGLAEHVRQTVARRLPEFQAADVDVSISAVAPGRLAKDTAAALPGGVVPSGPLVVTLRRSLPTCEGPACREVVRVTVDTKGRIRKVALSK